MAEKSKIRRIEIEPSENGGHTVTHHLKEKPMHSTKHGMIGSGYQEPERHVFGKEEGHEMIAHVAEHLGINAGRGEAGEKDQDEEDE